jgi:hypothetical protein
MFVKVIVSNRPTNDITQFGLCKRLTRSLENALEAVSNSLTKLEKSLNSGLLGHVLKKMPRACYYTVVDAQLA